MIKIIDTHNHLYFPSFKNSFQETLQSAQASGVKQQILIGIDELSCQAALNLAAENKDFKVALGLHPCDVDQLGVYNSEHHQYLGINADLRPQITNRAKYFTWLDTLATKHPETVVAFGETGFDQFHRESTALLKLQTISFKQHLELCVKHQKTLIIHSRGARDVTLKFLEEHTEEFAQINFVWHCFTEDLAAAEKVIELGGYIGIGGVATYPKSEEIREVIEALPVKQLVTETDAPFLTPHQARKQGAKQNSPTHLPEVVKLIAEIKNLDTEACAMQLYKNAQKAFKL